MAITIDYTTFVVFVPRADLTLVQATPTEIRSMDLNWFRLQVKAIEDTALGMPYPDVTKHNTEVSLGGLTYARVIEVLEPYTVTFEDGAYAVNLQGANSNVGDRVNVNQVSVRSSNSAGMTSSPDIEYASFNGGISYDEINGLAGVGQASSGANIGTPRAPSNNAYDARTIATTRGFTLGYIIGDMNVPEYELDDVTPFEIYGFTFQGSGKDRTVITIPAIPDMHDCTYLDAKVTGYLDGDNTLNGCIVENLDYIKGYIELCVLSDVGEITLGGSDTASFLGCYSSEQGTTLNLGGSGQPLLMGNHSGSVTLKNKNGNDNVRIGLSDGEVRLDMTTVVSGTIIVTGTGRVCDDLTNEYISSGVYGSLIVDNQAINRSNISEAVWNESISDHLIPGTTGKSIGIAQFAGAVSIDMDDGVSGTEFPIGTITNPVNNLEDAILIASSNNIETFKVAGTLTLTQDVSGKEFISLVTGHINLNNQICLATVFKKLKISGVQASLALFYDCGLTSITGLNGNFVRCYFLDTTPIIVATNATIMIDNSRSQVPGNDSPILDYVNGGIDLSNRAYSGGIRVINSTDALNTSTFEFIAGKFNFPVSNTAGYFAVRGVLDSTGIDVSATATITYVGSVSSMASADAVWEELALEHTVSGTMGAYQASGGTGGGLDEQALHDGLDSYTSKDDYKADTADTANAVWANSSATQLLDDVSFIRNIEGGKWEIVNNQMIFYTEDNGTEVARFNLYNNTGVPGEENIFKRVRV